MNQLSSETRMVLQRFTEGRLSQRDFGEWLVQSDYDTDLSSQERDVLAGIRLIVIEADEGMRPASEIIERVTATLNGEPGAGRQSA